MPVAGKAALVTGGGRGIGVAIAQRLAKDGADVAFTFNRSREGAQAVEREIQAMGRRCVAIQADAADPASARRMVEETVAQFGGIDILVNNAAVANVAPLQELSPEQIQEMLDINLRGVVLACQAVLDFMPAGGRIINIGSALADRSFSTGVATYAMTKAGLAGFTRALAREIGPRDINVNIIHPGNTYSDMNPPGNPKEDYLRSLTALGRYNDAADIAAAVAFLVSDDARQITGAALSVDGGMNA